MRKFLCNILLVLLINQDSNAQVLDRAPSGEINVLPVEGGAYRMKIDSTTALEDLIDRLNDNWEFIETGKAYWIGYTNDMFSIAARGDEAIPALINFFKRTKIVNGKIGAIYTMHLIGINRRIVGRTVEKFTNPKARMALLGFLKEKIYAYNIINLLTRDPWQSDIPYFFQILKNESDDQIVWPLIKSLNIYKISGLPIDGLLPDQLNNLKIHINAEKGKKSGKNFEVDAQVKEVLSEFGNKYPDSIKIEKELYTQRLSNDRGDKVPGYFSIGQFISRLDINTNRSFEYLQIGCKIQYYVQEGKLYFCTIKTAQQRLNEWWSNLSSEEKEKFK